MTAPEDHLRRWLTGVQSGCYFAARFAARTRGALTTVIATVNETTGPIVEAAVDGAAATKDPQIIIFPSMRTPTDVARLLARFAPRPRWSLQRLAWRGAQRAGDVPLTLRFTTHAGLTFAAMGLAPIGAMPVTRRAPYVAMVLWGGGHENTHWPHGDEARGDVEQDDRAHEVVTRRPARGTRPSSQRHLLPAGRRREDRARDPPGQLKPGGAHQVPSSP